MADPPNCAGVLVVPERMMNAVMQRLVECAPTADQVRPARAAKSNMHAPMLLAYFFAAVIAGMAGGVHRDRGVL